MNKLYAALFAAKSEMPVVPKDKTNPHFKSKYAPLDTILRVIEPVLFKHGLLLLTPAEFNHQGRAVITCRLVHVETGELLESSMPMPESGKAQEMGSAITYYRRYLIGALLNLNIDDDDDGNSASAPEFKQKGVSNSNGNGRKAEQLW